MRHYILNTGVDAITKEAALARTETFIASGKFHSIVTPNPEIVLRAYKDNALQGIINNASLSLCDGTGLYFAGILRGKRFPERIRGVDFMWELCKLAEKKSYHVRLVGAEENVREHARRVLHQTFPELVFSDTPHITFIALGAPKQELAMAAARREGATGVFMGVGGALDIIAGRHSRAPVFVQKIGLEWLWRLLLQPSRARRIWQAIVVFPLTVMRYDT